jgi:dipeptidyl aminopeptidase/acylaminoacyl peptidase
MNSPLRRALAAVALFLLTASSLTAQSASVQQTGASAPASAAAKPDPKSKKALSIADYSRWRTINSQQISPDGQWAAYVLQFTNVVATDQKPELHIVNLATNKDTVIRFATAPEFSSDSRWITYQIEIPATPPSRGARPDSAATDTSAAARARAGNQPPNRRAELRELATGKTTRWENVANTTFSPTSSHLLVRRRAASATGATAGTGGGPGGGGGGGFQGAGAEGTSAAQTMRGLDALLHDVNTSKSQFLGSVGDASFNQRGDLLAYTVEATVKDGNGLFAIELVSGRSYVLDNDARTYSRLAWNDAGTGIAVLKAKDVPRMRERDNVLLAIPNVRAVLSGGASAPKPVTLDTTAAGFMKGFVISDRASLSWSDDNRRVFFGVIPRTAAPDTARRRSADSTADVDVWTTQDERIQSLQMLQANADRNFTFRQAVDLTSGKYIALSDSSLKSLEVGADGRWAVGRDARGYVADYGRPRADVYRVNTMTGERTLIAKGLMVGNRNDLGISADGKGWLFWDEDKIKRYDLETGTTRVLGGSTAPSFTNMEFEYPGPKPSYGIAGYSADGKGVIAQHRYDLWYLPVDGSAARNLTKGEGEKGQIRFRLARTVPADPMAPRAQRDQRSFDLAKPITLSAYGEWTKKSGYYEIANGALRTIVFDDASYSTPERALKAEQYLLRRERFEEYPDLRVSGPNFGQSRRISDANPQQAEFLWGRRVLFDYALKDGRKMQGILALPDDYKEGEKRPMIVTFYERNSHNMHRYTPPSFITGMGNMPVEAVSRGYVTMLPDVFFRTGSSHSDMLDAVEAATKRVIELGYADPKRIGVHGHSYGGEGAAFIGTQSKLFAAVGMGAGVTDLYSDFSQSWGWSYQVNAAPAANAFSYYMEGQGRWGFSPWDKPDVYMHESALTHAPKVTTPFLIMHGTADPTVSFQEGLSFYQALRFNKKQAYLLAYPNEGHGLRGLANRRDLTTRYFQFFDHYLKGSPAPKWMTDGVPYLQKDAPVVRPQIIP